MAITTKKDAKEEIALREAETVWQLKLKLMTKLAKGRQIREATII